ncbi:hypothetical protein EVAR_58903_1 [Eumeta japonica]|uniref:Uncharacterized protein n=1 Tax=Eumeta variegata TaxID=151549 RepID=A0A4C1Z228_EUMVA|nr:hypothetical protein EVAR_58903_1 [Eumeta japonica]
MTDHTYKNSRRLFVFVCFTYGDILLMSIHFPTAIRPIAALFRGRSAVTIFRHGHYEAAAARRAADRSGTDRDLIHTGLRSVYSTRHRAVRECAAPDKVVDTTRHDITAHRDVSVFRRRPNEDVPRFISNENVVIAMITTFVSTDPKRGSVEDLKSKTLNLK